MITLHLSQLQAHFFTMKSIHSKVRCVDYARVHNIYPIHFIHLYFTATATTTTTLAFQFYIQLCDVCDVMRTHNSC